MKNKMLILILAILIGLGWSSPGLSLEEKTHEAINQYIAQKAINGFSLNDYLVTNLGIEKGINEIINELEADGTNRSWRVFLWLGYGGEQEDRPGSWKDYLPLVGQPTRSVNHFSSLALMGWRGIFITTNAIHAALHPCCSGAGLKSKQELIFGHRRHGNPGRESIHPVKLVLSLSKHPCPKVPSPRL